MTKTIPTNRWSPHGKADCNSKERFRCSRCKKSVCWCAGTTEAPVCDFCISLGEGVKSPEVVRKAMKRNWTVRWWAQRVKAEAEGRMGDPYVA